MKLISWNVNGMRAVMGKGFMDFFNEADADIFCIQETKLQEGQLEIELSLIHISRLAQNIVAEQTAGIDCLRKVQRCCRNVTNCCTDLCEYKCRVNRIIKTMMQDIDCAYIDNSIECNFIRQMLPQQRAGLMMAKTAMCYCICDELKPVLNLSLIHIFRCR